MVDSLGHIQDSLDTCRSCPSRLEAGYLRSVDGLQVDDERRNRLAERKYVRSVVKRGVEREKIDLGVGLSGRLVAWHRVPNLSFTYPTNPKYGPDLINV